MNKDLVRVKHMLDACRELLNFVRGRSKKDLETDRMLVLALIKDLEILGEAAAKVSPEFQMKHPQVPWKGAIGTRNRLTHGYFDVDPEIIWSTVKRDIPELCKLLEEILLSL